MTKNAYHCENCNNKFLLVFEEEGDEPTICPFCEEELVSPVDLTEDLGKLFDE